MARKQTAKATAAPAKTKRASRAKEAKPEAVKVTAAKGRPMLSWVGKKPLSRVTAFPAQHIETFDPLGDADTRAGEIWEDWPSAYPRGGLLFHGDNKEVLAHLLANGFRGKVDLIYIDPPFDSGADYVRRVSLRGAQGIAKLDAESYSLGEQIQYEDIWTNDTYLQFMYERLLLLRELLATDGSFYLHCDTRKSHLLRSLLDEVFGQDAFQSEIVWQSSDAQSGSVARYGPIHNTIYFYSGSPDRTWNDLRVPLSQPTADNWYTNEEVLEEDIVNALGVPLPKGTTRRFNKADLTARKRGGDTEYAWHGVRPPAGRYWAYSRSNMEAFEAQGLLVYSESGRPYLKRYLDEVRGTPLQDVWTDISMLRGISGGSETDYPTEKPVDLIRRIVQASSKPGDLVLDCFMGSGTTARVAQEYGRRWIGCDINKGAILTCAHRLQRIIDDQSSTGQEELLPDEEASPPAQLSFTTWRVNDYDLQIQHNEAVALACEHLGVERSRTDRYFDGTLGNDLVKIVPFNHPLSPADLEDIRRELDAHPDEDRNIKVVCLGIELAAQAWLDEWNQMRRGANMVNRIDAIELRTDERYGAFMTHDPASAKVTIERKDDRIHVRIDDFLSPTIVKRLAEQTGVVEPRIDDWRAMVDCVMIDTAYDGEVFNITLSDIPERKTDFIRGEYDLPAPKGKTTAAVKIIDMLGEEVLVVS